MLTYIFCNVLTKAQSLRICFPDDLVGLYPHCLIAFLVLEPVGVAGLIVFPSFFMAL